MEQIYLPEYLTLYSNRVKIKCNNLSKFVQIAKMSYIYVANDNLFVWPSEMTLFW